jgi:hypothetical protein
MRRSLLWLLPILLLTGCTRRDVIRAAPPQTTAAWLTIQPYTAIKIASLEIIVAKKGSVSFREAGLIP